jgi:hypothetical protein
MGGPTYRIRAFNCSERPRASDNNTVSLLSTCCHGFARLSRAAAKVASAKLRAAGVGRSVDPARRQVRLGVCQSCPVAQIDKGRVYCGRPLLNKIVRDPAIDGCGCPILAKANDPTEHCPINASYRAARPHPGGCDCRWCEATANAASRRYSTSIGNAAS